MKKNLKKCLALVLSVMMIMAMTVNVFADEETYSLKVNSHTDYDTAVQYNVYQLFKCDLDSNNVPSYTADGAVNSNLVGDKTVEWFATLAKEADELYAFAGGVSTQNVTPYKTLTTGTAINVPAGYYLLVPTNTANTTDSDSDNLVDAGGTVSAPILVAVPEVTKKDDGTYEVTGSVEITSKDSSVTHKKKITDVESTHGTNDTISVSQDTATSGQNDTIEYTITNTVPLYKKDVDKTKVNYFVVDNYDTNLTLAEGTPITVTAPEGLKAGNSVSVEKVTAANGTIHDVYRVSDGDYAIVRDDTNHTFKVYFNYDKISSTTNVIIKAKFTLNPTATPGTPVVNDSELTYTNNYYTGTDSVLKDKVQSYTFEFKVFKYDTKNNAALKDAEFGLYTDSSCETEAIATATSGEEGVVNFNIKLNEGKYYVKETVAPNGYRVDNTIHEVEIAGNKNDAGEYDGTCTVKVDGAVVGTSVVVKVNETDTTIYEGDGQTPVFGVANTAGTTLPGTGGIGTTIFTFGGLALVVLAAVLFIVYTRKQKKQA